MAGEALEEWQWTPSTAPTCVVVCEDSSGEEVLLGGDSKGNMTVRWCVSDVESLCERLTRCCSQLCTVSGEILRTWSCVDADGDAVAVSGVAVDMDSLFVSDAVCNCVMRFDCDGDILVQPTLAKTWGGSVRFLNLNLRRTGRIIVNVLTTSTHACPEKHCSGFL